MVLLKTTISIIYLSSLLYCQIPSHAEFKTPPLKSYPKPLFFWNNTNVKAEQLKNQIKKFIEKDGYSGFGIIPFGEKFLPKYLSKEYFEIYREALSAAKDLEATVFLYDEYGFPSGSGGAINGDGIGRFKERYPNQTIKRLDKIEFNVQPGSEISIPLPTNSKIMSMVAMDSISLRRINLMSNVNDTLLKWEAPAGTLWKVMIFVCVSDGDPNVDYLNPDAVKNYIIMTHQEYYKKFKEYFSDVIIGTFFDEPTLYRAQGRIWTEDFNEKFQAKYNFNPEILYPALWYNIGPQTEDARNYLFGFRSELYANGFMKEINDWSEKHDVLATGHQDNEEILNPVSVSGDLMKWTKYLSIPGIDKIGGDRPAEKFYKIISSAAYNWDKTLVMSETYGAMGNISWDSIYQVAMDQYAKGINLLIPHAVWYDTSNVTFLPELSYRNPLYSDSLPLFNLFLARMNLMMQNDGHPINDVAVLYPIHTLQAGHYFDGPLGFYKGGVEILKTDYIQVSELLTNQLGKDFTFLHPEVLDEKCSVKNGEMFLNNKNTPAKYKVLILPSCKVLSPGNLDKIKLFYKSGGNLIFTSQLPVKSTILEKDSDVTSFISNLFPNHSDTMDYQFSMDSIGGKAFYIPTPDEKSLNNTLEKSLPINDMSLEYVKNIRFVHKKLKGQHLIYLANLNMNEIETKLTINGKYDFEIWNPHSGEIYDILEKNIKEDDRDVTYLKLNMPKTNSLFLLSK